MFKLCYIHDAWAYFTSQALKSQWGDDWDDAPYDSNAGDPYEPCWHNLPKEVAKRGKLCECDICKEDWNKDGTPKWKIVKVAFDSPFNRPTYSPDTCYSVRDVNSGKVPWLWDSYELSDVKVKIMAGASLKEFVEVIEASRGRVYFTKELFENLDYYFDDGVEDDKIDS